MGTKGWRVYVASAFSSAETVRAVHREMHARGWQPTSRWAQAAFGPESLACEDAALLRAAGEQNDTDILSSHAVLVLIAADARPKETFCEARFAQIFAIPVVWVGPPCLTTFRTGVQVCSNLAAAFVELERMRLMRRPASGGLTVLSAAAAH